MKKPLLEPLLILVEAIKMHHIIINKFFQNQLSFNNVEDFWSLSNRKVSFLNKFDSCSVKELMA
jgi:hypothetical protein